MEKTEQAIVTLAEVGSKVATSLADDGRISISEGIGISMKALGIIAIFKNLGTIRDEIKNITVEKKDALIAKFQAAFDLPNDEAEKRVEEGIIVLINLAYMVFGNENEPEVSV